MHRLLTLFNIRNQTGIIQIMISRISVLQKRIVKDNIEAHTKGWPLSCMPPLVAIVNTNNNNKALENMPDLQQRRRTQVNSLTEQLTERATKFPIFLIRSFRTVNERDSLFEADSLHLFFA